MKIHKKDVLEYHAGKRPGKIQVVPTKPCSTQRDLSLAYTPGVAEPCREIKRHGDNSFHYTSRANLVAVVSNGTAVLGLGNIGASAAKPVMEGKGVLFKRFADIDVFDLELDTEDPDEVVRVVKLLEPTFGGINLEDIRAPDCFHVEEKLTDLCQIPIFHDDQHGTAIITSAALINALELAKKKIGEVRIVICGAGAAGIACAKLLVRLGASLRRIVMCDSRGVIYKGRTAGMNPYKERFAAKTGLRTLEDALKGADVFIGVSSADIMTDKMVLSMAGRPVIFALANPDPEISYDRAKRLRPDAIVATGRSDFPNQVNNVLGFPFIFRGALDVRARAINERMKVAASHALADLAKENVPEQVCRAYDVDSLEFGRDYLIPKPFDPRVLLWEASAVAKAACETGVARQPITDFEKYWEDLEKRLGRSREMMRHMINKAKRPRRRGGSIRIAFPEGDDEHIIRAAHQIVSEGIGVPVLFGHGNEIAELAQKLSVNLDGIELLDINTHPLREAMSRRFTEMRARKGIRLVDARRLMGRRHYYAPMLLLHGAVDAVVCGETRHYPDAIRPALQIIPLKEGIKHASGLYMLMFKDKVIFCADTTVNITPDSETLAEIAICAAETVRRFDFEPKLAMLSFSDFGSVRHPLSILVREAVRIVKEREPDLIVDGEMQANTALVKEMLVKDFPFSLLKEPANVLIFPDLTSGNIAYKLLMELGGAEAIGPVLMGLSKSYHVLQRGSPVDAIVNVAAIAAVQAQQIIDDEMASSAADPGGTGGD